ncbi:N-acetylmuramoyl-L-alanine amidase [Flagellimonas sp. HMM57]|uniref:N-acetylmuramoyl-L-alanine amidase family protein n=1 Tax=unclassified Flagellimonas TaxID=2644544 RepID=UPI0013D33DFD|nr:MULTISPECIES: N-acetylmuramoyl-L-alanine amidase [unclassified Flagellimonas]UII76160.1 N-acetylmuramoyl-L-alanine amidase [Flagellimonas sp. HMM57]
MNKSQLAFFTFLFVSLSLTSFNKNDTEVQTKDKFVVVLDAGHGGHDPGNLGNGYLEKNIALAIVLKTGEELKKNSDVKVIYTRDDDSFVDLFVRGKIANDANADLFVSVHCDSHSSDAHGAGTFVLGLHANRQNFEVAKKENSVIYLEDNYEQRYAEYDINSPESVIGLTIMQEEFLDNSILLGKVLQDNFTKQLKRKDRKVKQAGFIVLHQTFMPSVLVETGFLTNVNEGKYLNSEKGQREMGKAIAQAILTYKKNVDTGLDIASEVDVVEDIPEVVNASTETKKPADEKANAQKVTPTTNPEEKKTEIVDTSSNSEPSNTAGVIFKVQLMASAKNIPLTGANFNELDMLSKEPFNNLYRYMYGNASTYNDAKRLKAKADAKGYTTSYIVAYKDGVRVSLSEAIK